MLLFNPLTKALGILCVFLAMLLAILGLMYKSEKSARKECDSALTAFITTQNVAADDANKSATKVAKEIVYIKERSKPNIIYIDSFKGEPNATKCDTATILLGTYTFN